MEGCDGDDERNKKCSKGAIGALRANCHTGRMYGQTDERRK